MKLVGGQPVDLPKQAPLQNLSGKQLDEISALEMSHRELHGIERPPLASKAALEEALCRREPMSG
jgi:hypothetical protein